MSAIDARVDELLETQRRFGTMMHEQMGKYDALCDVLRRAGFVECNIAACNCGSWHQVYGWPERFREIDEATKDDWRNGETLLARVQRIVSERNALREMLARVSAALDLNDHGELFSEAEEMLRECKP